MGEKMIHYVVKYEDHNFVSTRIGNIIERYDVVGKVSYIAQTKKFGPTTFTGGKVFDTFDEATEWIFKIKGIDRRVRWQTK